jgi:predicted Rossmann fold nucleotide-binding protein DprA/Smf involved in DNA uptake
LDSEENFQDNYHLFFELGTQVANDGYTLVTSEVQELNKSVIRGALEKEGTVIIFIANNLLQASLNSQYRKSLMSNDLVLVSAYHPESLVNTKHSLENSKYIEAQSVSIVKINSKIKNSTNFVENKILNKEKIALVKGFESFEKGSIQLSLFDDNSETNSTKHEELTDLFFNFFVSQLRLQYTLHDIFKPKELEIIFTLKLSQINGWLEEATNQNIIKKLEGRVKKYQLVENL